MQPDQQSSDGRKVLIVIGKMGSGRSSFIRTLMMPNDSKELITQNMPQISGGLMITTEKSDLYTVHPSHNLMGNNEPLQVIDTQGLDSEKSCSLILQEIDTLIDQNKLVIVGIAYVIRDRCQGGDGSSFLGMFLKQFKLRRKYLNNLFFCVHSNWFNTIDSCNQEEKRKSLSDSLVDLGLLNVFKKTVYWDSGPNNPKGYAKYLQKVEKDEECRTALERQWVQLRENLTSQISHICPIKTYYDDVADFWEKLRTEIHEIYTKYSENATHSFSWQQTNFEFTYTFEKRKQQVKENSNFFSSLWNSHKTNKQKIVAKVIKCKVDNLGQIQSLSKIRKFEENIIHQLLFYQITDGELRIYQKSPMIKKIQIEQKSSEIQKISQKKSVDVKQPYNLQCLPCSNSKKYILFIITANILSSQSLDQLYKKVASQYFK